MNLWVHAFAHLLCPLSLLIFPSPPATPPLLLSAAIPLLPVIIKVFTSEEWMNYRMHRQGLWFVRCEWKITPLFPPSIACLMKSKSWSHNQKRVLYPERDLMWFVTFLFLNGDYGKSPSHCSLMHTLIAADYLGNSSLSLRETNEEQKQPWAVRLNAEEAIGVYKPSSGLFPANG